MLSSEIQAEILSLYYKDKRSVRSIARDLGLHRDSVRSTVKRKTVSLVPSPAKRTSILDPFIGEIDQLLKRDPQVTATAAFNRLRELGYAGGISILRELIAEKKSSVRRPRQAFLRLEFLPGECAQVDWGEFGDVFGDGIKIHCFAMVLCYSRMLYIEFTRSEKFEDFIRCHENAFKYFGGVPKECWYDNLATAVTDRLGNIIKFNSRFYAYLGHHLITPHACNVARGNEKGRVEDAIKYIRNNFWAGRHFTDFDDLVKQSIIWRNQVANQREHRTTRKIVRLHFAAEEKEQLMPMNQTPFGTDEVVSKLVPSDFHVVYETNRYSVPWTLTGLPVTLKINDQQIKIYYNEKLITSYMRCFRKHQVFTTERHREGLLERKPGASRVDWQVSTVRSYGPKMHDYINLLKSGQRSLRVEMNRMVALATVYGEKAVYEACEDLLENAVVGVSSLELALKRKYHPAQSELKPEPIQFGSDQRLNRVVPAGDLRQYDALLLESINESASEMDELNDSGNFGEKPTAL